MVITPSMLRSICPHARKNADVFVSYLNDTMQLYHIDTPLRVAMFIAQLAHESDSFRYTRELWGPTPAQRRYEGRKDLGNTQPGDGSRFRGRGLIQVTGRANYAACGKALGLDLLTHPELLETPRYAVLSAGWFWDRNELNKLSDTGNVTLVTRRINGGTNGLESRSAFYLRALEVLAKEG